MSVSKVISFSPSPEPSYAILNLVRKTACWILVFMTCLVLVFMHAPGPALAGPNPQATISKSIFIQSPREDQALQGVVLIEGKMRGEGFLVGTVHFSYSDSPEEERTWFLVEDLVGENQESSQTAFEVEWDTTQITDGNYDLRVVAEYESGAAIFELVPGLRIRNHTPVETAQPGSPTEMSGEEPPLPPSFTPEPARTPTPLPPNPVEVRSGDLQKVLVSTGIAVAGIFFIGIIYWIFSSKNR